MPPRRRNCLVGLILIFTLVGATQLHFLLLHVTSQPHPCGQIEGIAIVRHTTNCSRYLLCVVGHGIDMPPCHQGHVWSVRMVRCVPDTSPGNDCPRNNNNNNNTVAGNVSLTLVGEGIRLEQKGFSSMPQTYTAKNDGDLIESYFPNHPCTFARTDNILPHPKACHNYYNCSLSPEDRTWDVVEPLTVECPYPKLFSLDSGSCRHYTQVDCGGRPEYKTPCDYRSNCDTHDCKKCPKRLAGCLGLRDGSHPFPSREWTPWYIVCKDERTLEQTTCKSATPIFSPYTRDCVTSAWVPKQYGGQQPLCYGRPDGYHPEERGACVDFFQCKNGNFMDYFACDEGLAFDPETFVCSSMPRIPPCGNHVSSDILTSYCKGLPNGFHADPYGRCSLYIECVDENLTAYLKCLVGSFDPTTKMCDNTLNLPAPCGYQPNECKSKEDGVYPSTDCSHRVTCRRGYVSSIDQCPGDDEIFDAQTDSCRDVRSVIPRCGIMLGCRAKRDGKRAATIKGCKYFYTCRDGVPQSYGACKHEKTKIFYNPVTKSCESLRDVCSPCGNKRGCLTNIPL